MRKTRNISKRVAIAILAAAMLMTTVSVSVAQPVTVWALNVEEGQIVQQTETDIDENRGQIGTNSEGITVTENGAALQYQNATIETNNGTVLNNYAHIGVNNGHVFSNTDRLDGTGGGEISENRGSVDGNYSSITENYGALGFNYEEGQVNVNGRIAAEDKVGSIDISYGKVIENHGVITENAAEPTIANYSQYTSNNWDRGVITNASDGVIVENSGATYTNQGTINKNTGTVVDVAGSDAVVIDNENYIDNVGNNSDGGTVELNGASATINILCIDGTVTNNFGEITLSDGGTIVNQYDGSVYGSTSDTTITNYFGGDLSVSNSNATITVTNNFADVTEETDAATAEIIGANGVNQYRSVSFVAAENSSVSYNDDFTEKTLLNSDGTRDDTKYYINVTGNNGSGTITIVAEQGYKVGLNANASANGTKQTETYGFTYELVPDGNNYKLNITGYNGNSCELSVDMFGLVISAIQNVNPNPNPGPNPRAQSVPVVNDDTAEVTSAATEQPVASVSATFTATQIQAMIESALAESLAQANGAAVTVIDLYLGNDPSLTADAVVALCGGNVAKRCYFTHNGQKFILFVPVMDTTSTAYQQCLVLLDAEPGKQAGPIRLSQIFAGVDVSLSQE